MFYFVLMSFDCQYIRELASLRASNPLVVTSASCPVTDDTV